MNIVILGRQPKLGLAELESLCGAAAVWPFGSQSALVHAPLEAQHLGGARKIAVLLAECPAAAWPKLATRLVEQLTELMTEFPDKKLHVGISTYGVDVTPQDLFRTGLELKKTARAHKRSIRIVPSRGASLNSAAVLHNRLTGPHGIELIVVRHGSTARIGQTIWVQDIDNYARRDFGRPRRDAFVGMLPPKLAQIMLNLARVTPDMRVLDPFCGTGVVLQEAALRGCAIYGTDMSERMIDFTRDNLHWLQHTYHRKNDSMLETADATTATWRPPIDTVVCETYLGQPLSGLPKPEKLQRIVQDCNTILSKFFRNLRPQLTPGERLCIAVPAWFTGTTYTRLPLLDHLEEMGYNRLRFQHSAWDDLIYRREDQIVARELLVVTVI